MATVYYLDQAGRQVNVVAPRAGNTQTNFEATTTEYDEHDNVIRELSEANRRKALAMGGNAASARLYDTRRTFSPDGLEWRTSAGDAAGITDRRGRDWGGATRARGGLPRGGP